MEEIVEIGRGKYINHHTGLLINIDGGYLFLFDNNNTGWVLSERYRKEICDRFPQYKTAWWVDRDEVVLTDVLGEIK